MMRHDSTPTTNLTRTTGPADGDGASAGNQSLLDYIGVGFGPSNLALAIAAKELAPALKGLFFETKPSFQWHPGMMLDGVRMQISYLKDLATLRNPTSPFSFLQYLKVKGRLERFVNLCDFFPTRMEYQDYMAWAADAFRHQVHYGAVVRKITPVFNESKSCILAFCVQVKHTSSGPTTYFTKNLIYAPGGHPNALDEQVSPSPAIMHAHNFALLFPERFPDRLRNYTFAVVGDGQSAAEIVKYLRDSYPNSRTYLVISGYGLRPADSTPFVNEVFSAREVDWFYGLKKEPRARIISQLRNTNYGVVDDDLIASLYRSLYQDEVAGTQRLSVLRFSRLISAAQNGAAVEVVTEDLCTDGRTNLSCDALILATGYVRRLDPMIFEDLLPFLSRNENGNIIVSRRYRAQTSVVASGGLYLQGLNESSHGIGDTLLSLLPFRSQEILDDIAERSQQKTEIVPQRPQATVTAINNGEYPPKRHLEEDEQKIYAVVERFPFATVVSADADQAFVTHVPLTLDRTRGSKGVLFGHLDKFNPQVALLDDRPILAIFHGPNAYISPHDYETDQLPTWNSITVHALGRVRRLRNQKDVVRGLLGISEYADHRPSAFRLSEDDPRIARLIEFIVGFEIEIEQLIGRFKLSQDRNPRDQELAKQVLIRRTEEGERVLIETVLPAKTSNAEPAMLAVGQD